MTLRRKLLRTAELTSYVLGTLLTGFFLVQLAQGEVERSSAIADFSELQTSHQQLALAAAAPVQAPEAAQAPAFDDVAPPDTSLWAPGRIADYQATLDMALPPVLGVLEVPSVALEVPVYQTNSDSVLDRASGVIDGMAYPHEPGNIGISGHRDGYFRALKDVAVGDTILLQTLEGEKQFTIDDIHIVEIDDTRLLQDTRDQTLTLVTCYPFYFVGHAPQRFIVTASLDTTNVNHN